MASASLFQKAARGAGAVEVTAIKQTLFLYFFFDTSNSCKRKKKRIVVCCRCKTFLSLYSSLMLFRGPAFRFCVEFCLRFTEVCLGPYMLFLPPSSFSRIVIRLAVAQLDRSQRGGALLGPHHRGPRDCCRHVRPNYSIYQKDLPF